MMAVIFEVWPAEGHTQHYLDLAAALRPELDMVDGFVSIERFQSLAEPDKLLSLSFWRDEAAIRAWRNGPSHRATQAEGRAGVFENYRLRIERRRRRTAAWPTALDPAKPKAATNAASCNAGPSLVSIARWSPL